MTAPTCVVCSKPMADTGYACHDEMRKAARDLTMVADMTPAARDVAQRQTSRAGGGSGKPGSSLPIDLGTTARLDAAQNALTGWARVTMEERQGQPFAPGPVDPIVHAAYCLAANLEWWRHRPAVEELLADVAACARVVAGIARGPAEQRYLGPCGAEIELCGSGVADEDETWWYCDLKVDHRGDCDFGDREIGHIRTCDGDVYGRPDADLGHCRTCGATVDQRERQAWLDGEVRQRAYRASEIEDAYGIKANLIRQWATPERGLLRVHDRDFLGRARYMLGEVLDLAAGQKLKAAARAAERERRAAAREAAEMGA